MGQEQKKGSASLSLIFSSLKMSVAVFISRILGLVREQVMAHAFGASALTDAFLVAYRIPNLLRDLLAEGAFSAAFVPVFAEARLKSEQEARELLWSTFLLLALVTGTIGILIFAFSEEFITLFAPGFTKDPEKLQLAIGMTKVMAPYLFFVSLAALLMGVLNSLKIFFMPALAPAAFNVIMIACTLTLPVILIANNISPVYSLAIGVLFGGMIQLVIQIPLIFKRAYGPIRPKIWISPMAIKIVKRLGPGLIGFAATQINILVTTILASNILGAVSWLNYAFRLFQFPVGIVGVAVGSSHLVHFSESIKNNDLEKAKQYLRTSFFFSLFLMIPSAAILFGPASEIVNLIFERGRFLSSDTHQTALMLKCYALSLPFYGMYKIFIPTLYAMDKQKIPVMLTLISIACNVIFCLSLVPHFGVVILALGMSLTMLINSIGCQIFVMKYLKISWTFFLNKRLAIFIMSGIATYFFALKAGEYFYDFNAHLWHKLLMIILICSLSGLGYLFMMVIFGEKELLRRIWRRN